MTFWPATWGSGALNEGHLIPLTLVCLSSLRTFETLLPRLGSLEGTKSLIVTHKWPHKPLALNVTKSYWSTFSPKTDHKLRDHSCFSFRKYTKTQVPLASIKTKAYLVEIHASIPKQAAQATASEGEKAGCSNSA